MTNEDLVKSASELAPFPYESCLEYAQKIDILIARINAAMLTKSNICKLAGGSSNISMMRNNHANHVRFVASLLNHYKPQVLVETVLWVFRSYRSRGFCSDYWAVQISEWGRILKAELSPETYAAIDPLYDWLYVNIPAFTDLSAEQLARAQNVIL